MDSFIEDVIATADAVRARGRHKKRINLSFDEWNVWYIHRFSGDGPKPTAWSGSAHPRLIEDEYSVTDAVVVGTFLNSLLRHGDRVTVANQAQLVNVIGLLRSEEGGEAWKQTIAYPFEQMRRLAQGQIVQVVASGDKFDSDAYTDVPFVDTSATYDAASGRAALFVANRSLTSPPPWRSTCVASASLGAGAPRCTPGGQDRHTTNTSNTTTWSRHPVRRLRRRRSVRSACRPSPGPSSSWTPAGRADPAVPAESRRLPAAPAARQKKKKKKKKKKLHDEQSSCTLAAGGGRVLQGPTCRPWATSTSGSCWT